MNSDDSQVRPLRIALCGFGVVGSAVAKVLQTQAADLTARVGAPLELVGVAVRRADTDRSASGLPPEMFTTDALALVEKADIVIEVIGGIEPARSIILKAFEHGASVVTANKALLAENGPTLYAAAEKAGVDLYYEAAVAGAIPLLRPLRTSLAGDSVNRVLGIVNGTTNYVLDQMDTEGLGFNEAVSQAQQLGYAEADPTADVEGFDAAAKASILASLAFHTRVPLSTVSREGITAITTADMAAARDMGHVVKLLAICERTPTDSGEGISVRVHPAMVPADHPLASVRGAFNAVFVEATGAGDLMFYGPGAGGEPTASAVMGDVVAQARHKVRGGLGPAESAYAGLPVLDPGQALTRYYMSLEVTDRPGVLAAVAGLFSDNKVSIQQVRQNTIEVDEDNGPGRLTTAELVIVTHEAHEADLAATVQAISELDVVRGVNSVMRVIGG